MSQTQENAVQYEYVPMSVEYSGIKLGFGFGEGVGINASGGLRGHVTIHEYKTNEVQVSVFSATGVVFLAPRAFRQATVKVTRNGYILASELVTKQEPYVISSDSAKLYMGAVRITLSAPVDLMPLEVHITAVSGGFFYEGFVPGKTQEAVVPINVRQKAAMQ